MITTSDILRLPYTEDLTRAGIVYASRSLAYTYNRMGGSPFDRLRRIVAGKAFELAFRRYLSEKEVPHDNLGTTPFTDPDHYDIALGGRRCDLKSYLVRRREDISRLRRDPATLLSASGLVPLDQFGTDHLHEHDLYIFAYISALVAASPDEMKRALLAGQPTFCIYPFPGSWVRPSSWTSLGQLVVKTDSSQGFLLELGGQTYGKEFETVRLYLEPHKRTPIEKDYYSLAYMYTPRVPDGQVGVYSPQRDQVHMIQPSSWGNIWIYGMDIFLAGYITVGEFRKKAERLPAGSPSFPYPKTRTENMAIPIKSLYPLGELFGRAREWAHFRNRI